MCLCHSWSSPVGRPWHRLHHSDRDLPQAPQISGLKSHFIGLRGRFPKRGGIGAKPYPSYLCSPYGYLAHLYRFHARKSSWKNVDRTSTYPLYPSSFALAKAVEASVVLPNASRAMPLLYQDSARLGSILMVSS